MIEERFMRRALELAAFGAGFVSPNPMVGAVVVDPDGRIIGEGWHRRYGGPHAEVNAIASVSESDRRLLPESTIYVTLEPCSHYGKTPPCASLIIKNRLKRVVVGALDPFKAVRGNGIRMLREAGIEVIENCLEPECMEINKRFMTAHNLERPWIILKWAQSADGFMAARGCRLIFSNPLSFVEMHKERSMCDAILAGTGTILSDNPSLTNRLWPGNSPRPVIFSTARIHAGASVMKRNPIILDTAKTLADNVAGLYKEHGITSLMVEGGAKTLGSFIEASLFDEIRMEISPVISGGDIPAPALPGGIRLLEEREIRKNIVRLYRKQ